MDTRLREGSQELALTTAASGDSAVPLDQLKRLDCMLQSALEEYLLAPRRLDNLSRAEDLRIDGHVPPLKDLNNLVYLQVLSSPKMSSSEWEEDIKGNFPLNKAVVRGKRWHF
jgi:hypothetical protein